MSELDPVAMNVPVEDDPQPVNVTAIRDAIAALIPKDDNIVSNVHLHDGLADISIRWRTLRFSTTEAIAGRDGDEIALAIDERFRMWLRNTIKNMQSIPKHSRVAADMARWLKQNPDKRAWLYGADEPEPMEADAA